MATKRATEWTHGHDANAKPRDSNQGSESCSSKWSCVPRHEPTNEVLPLFLTVGVLSHTAAPNNLSNAAQRDPRKEKNSAETHQINVPRCQDTGKNRTSHRVQRAGDILHVKTLSTRNTTSTNVTEHECERPTWARCEKLTVLLMKYFPTATTRMLHSLRKNLAYNIVIEPVTISRATCEIWKNLLVVHASRSAPTGSDRPHGPQHCLGRPSLCLLLPASRNYTTNQE